MDEYVLNMSWICLFFRGTRLAADRTRGGSGRRYRPPEAQAVSKRNEQVRNEAAAGREQRHGDVWSVQFDI